MSSNYNFDTFSEVSLGRECDFHQIPTWRRLETIPSHSSTQQSLRTRDHKCRWGIQNCWMETPLHQPAKRNSQGATGQLRWEPPPDSPTGSTCFNSLTGFQECSLEPVNKGLSKWEMQAVILFANLHPTNTDSQAIGFGFVSTQSPSLGVSSLESKFLYNEIDLAALLRMKFILRAKKKTHQPPPNTAKQLLYNLCQIIGC